MPGLDSFLWGGPAALVVAAAAFGGVMWATRRPGAAWCAGVVAGFAAGALAIDAHANGFSTAAARLMKPVEAHGRLPLVALAALAPGILAAATGRRWTLWLLAAPLAALAPLWLLWGGRYFPRQELRDAGFADGAWSAGQAAVILGGMSAAIVAAWWAWRRAEPATLPLVRSALAVIALGGAGATVACTGSITYAQLFGLLAVALAACGAVARLTGAKAGPEAAAGPVLALAGCLLVLAVCYSELHLWQAAALGALIAASAAWLPAIDRRQPAAAASIRAALVLVPLTAIVTQSAAELAASQRPEASEPPSVYTSK
jgi:hypothetical protein